ncbi:MAG TPA: penicillin-binding protein 2 [Alphaproteobacteria bacterium]
MAFISTLNDTGDQIVGARGSAVETARGRLMFMGVLFVAAFSIVSLRVGYLCLLQDGAEPRVEVSNAEGAKADALALGRADIVDRNGVLLATTLQTVSLYADPKFITSPETVSADLKKIFPDLNEKQIAERLSSKSRFVWVHRGLSAKDMEAVNALGQPGLNFQQENRRFYPQEELTSHIVGYTDIDGNGLAGMERAANDSLKSDSKPIALSIDVRFQHILRRALKQAVSDFTAKGGAGVIMDVQTGEVLAAVSYPDYNPQTIADATDDQKFNRFALGVYEMGSTFKTFAMSVLLDQVDDSLGQRFDATKPIKRGRFTISDYHPEKRPLTLPEVFMYSSNIGTALVGEKIGTKRLHAFYDELGLTKPVDMVLMEKGMPLVPNPWRDINTITATYGHGIAVSPLHLIRAFSGIVNGGTLPGMHFLKDEHDETRVRVISEETSEKMRHLLRLVVTHGTGSKADVPGMLVAGKTGTAEKSAGGGYSKNQVMSSFVGTFPADNPRYAILVSVDDPKGNKKSYGYATAGWVAAPAIASAVSSIRNLENIANADPAHDEAIETEMARYIKLEPKATKQLAAYER